MLNFGGVSTPPLENPLKLAHLHFESIAPLLRWNCKFSHPSLPTDSSSLGWWPNGIIFHQPLGETCFFGWEMWCVLWKAPPKSGENTLIHPKMRTCINVISTFQSKRECVFGNKTLAFLGWPEESWILLIWRWFTFFQQSWTDPKSTRCYNPLKWSDMGALMALKIHGLKLALFHFHKWSYSTPLKTVFFVALQKFDMLPWHDTVFFVLHRLGLSRHGLGVFCPARFPKVARVGPKLPVITWVK